jgi:hypothetical protein
MTNGRNGDGGLIGKWVLFPDPSGEDGYDLAGRITLSVGSDHHLVRINGPAPCSRLMSSDDLTADGVFIFDNEAELKAWLEWEEPDGGGPRVVSIREPAQ